MNPRSHRHPRALAPGLRAGLVGVVLAAGSVRSEPWQTLLNRSPFASPNPAAHASLSSAAEGAIGEYELHGYLVEGDTRRFSVRHVPSGRAVWLAPGETFRDLTATGAREDGSLTVEFDGREGVLALKNATLAGSATASASSFASGGAGWHAFAPAGSEQASRARQARAIRGANPAPTATTPIPVSNPPIHGATEGSSAAPAAESESANPPPRAETIARPAYVPLLGRTVNKVNSRIYASDHIKEFGPPAPATP